MPGARRGRQSAVTKHSQITKSTIQFPSDELNHVADLAVLSNSNEQVISVPQFLKAVNKLNPKSQSSLNNTSSKVQYGSLQNKFIDLPVSASNKYQQILNEKKFNYDSEKSFSNI